MLVTHTLSAFQLLLIYFTASAHPLSLSKPSAQGEVQDVARGFLRKRALPRDFPKGVGEGTKQFGRSVQAQRAGLCGHRGASDFDIMSDRTALWSELQRHWEDSKHYDIGLERIQKTGKDRKLPVVKLGGKKMEPMYESDSSSKSIEDCLELQEEIAKDHRKMETSSNDLTDGHRLENKAKLQSGASSHTDASIPQDNTNGIHLKSIFKDGAHSDGSSESGSSHRSIDDLFFQGMENVNEPHGRESSGPADKLVDNHLEPSRVIDTHDGTMDENPFAKPGKDEHNFSNYFRSRETAKKQYQKHSKKIKDIFSRKQHS
ncbi:hypothetical protein MJO28_003886 [Puccinia striiformis f. sp. tritici]|uniref:Uncharacterized protein n=1 Tax=Puccinia striiformis f. sp. tritici TaxID=168172 RepID=A0ACC0EN99_9BASI|nr:hypothetical protein MJO28_003886 [Puccinia striiformis f. sp. tritici]